MGPSRERGAVGDHLSARARNVPLFSIDPPGTETRIYRAIWFTTLAADAPAMQGARASAARVVTA